ncbi:ribbon-helix-helix domain-containing protein [Clostridium sp. BJN0013]|uniref:ribbon-helix-helix domain-containing protein n=1 Tax=Clostridium sp. BJN0013 TaxID=3236840 RepID=UPI0034C6DB63
MADKDLKNRTPFSNAVNTELLNKLKAYSKETGTPMSKLLDKAIESFLNNIKRLH